MFNFYCDESTHLRSDQQPYMILGYVSVDTDKIKKMKSDINTLKEKHNFFSEIKWVNLSSSKKDFYLELIQYFFENDLSFNAIVIDKSECVDFDFHEFEEFYYEMYLELLQNNIRPEEQYNIYLDIKDTLSSWKLSRLKRLLQEDKKSINNLQNIHSHESLFLQITDVLIGALNYDLRGKTKVTAKSEIINLIKINLDSEDFLSADSNPKFNVKFIKKNALQSD